MGKHREASVSYLTFDILYPESVLLPQCLLRRSRIVSDKFKQYEQAIELLNRIVTEFPDSKSAGNALLFMANIKEKKQKAYKEAVSD